MKATVIFSVFLALAAGFASPAHADKVVVAECHGKGAYFYLSEHNRDWVDIWASGIGVEPSPTADATFVVQDGNYRWDTRSRREIDRDCGGGGNDEIDLFPGLEPQSGLWQARLGETRLDGCPSVVQQYFPKSPGALPAEWMDPRRLTFVKPFHPDQLELTRSLSASGLSDVKWRADGDDAWTTEVFASAFGQIPAAQGQGSKMMWRLTVNSPKEITHLVTVQIVLPAVTEATLGDGNCRMTSVNFWVRVGD